MTLYHGSFVSVTMPEIKPYRLADQMLFHTEASLRFLHAVTQVEVPR